MVQWRKVRINRRASEINPQQNEKYSVFTDDIAPGVSLTCVKADRFTTGCMSLTLITGLDRQTAALTALLPRVLRRGSAELPGMEAIAAALDDLYGARIEPAVRKKGELHCAGLFLDFPDGRYVADGGKVFEKAAGYLCGMLLSPALENGFLREDYFSGEKQNLIDDIRASINDKRGHSINRLLEEMCSEEAYGTNKLGSEESALAATAKSLTAHYAELKASSNLHAFYCGSEAPERVAQIMRSALQGHPDGRRGRIPETTIPLYPPPGSPRIVTEEMDVQQGKLAAGFRLGESMKGRPDLAGLIVFNAVYGAGDTSKLFRNVREKLSLCYYVGSMIDKHKGIMVVSSGIESSSFDRTLEEIGAQLRNVKNGDVTDWELTAAKRSVVTAIRQSLDRPGGFEEIYLDMAVSKHPYDPLGLCEDIESVTLDRVVSAASGIEADTVYFLQSGGAGKEVVEHGD